MISVEKPMEEIKPAAFEKTSSNKSTNTIFNKLSFNHDFFAKTGKKVSSRGKSS